MKRVGAIALTALVVNVVMFALTRTELADDANTYQVIAFASFASRIVAVAALETCVIRVVDEFFHYFLNEMNR